jgi:hypothetical protein
MMPVIYGSSYQILQTPGYGAIRYEMVHVRSPDGKKLFVGSSAPVGSGEPPTK